MARTLDEANDYIKFLENELKSLETVNIKRLIVELDNFSGLLADDLKKIRTGNKESCVLITDEKSPVTDTVLKLVEKIESFKKVSEAAKTLNPVITEIDEEAAREEDINIPKIEKLPRRKI